LEFSRRRRTLEQMRIPAPARIICQVNAELKNRRPLVACPDDVSTKAEKEPKLVVGDPGPVACAGGTVRSVGTAWRQLSPDLRCHCVISFFVYNQI
jgi:hypothetical protein